MHCRMAVVVVSWFDFFSGTIQKIFAVANDFNSQQTRNQKNRIALHVEQNSVVATHTIRWYQSCSICQLFGSVREFSSRIGFCYGWILLLVVAILWLLLLWFTTCEYNECLIFTSWMAHYSNWIKLIKIFVFEHSILAPSKRKSRSIRYNDMRLMDWDDMSQIHYLQLIHSKNQPGNTER